MKCPKLWFNYLFTAYFIVCNIAVSSAQTIEKYYDYNWKECKSVEARFYAHIEKTDSGYVRNDYFLRERTLQMSGKYEDVECEIQNGYFKFFHSNGMLSSKGNYVHDKREGLWVAYHSNGYLADSMVYHEDSLVGIGLRWHENGFLKDSMQVFPDGRLVQISWFDNGNISLAGYSKNGQKIGIWQYFHNNGYLSAKEKYKDGVVIESEFYDEYGASKSNPLEDQKAIYPGGLNAWKRYIEKTIYFPGQYKIVNADKAVVVVRFIVDEEGNVSHVEATTPFHPDFDRIAIDAIKKSKKWSPAVSHNRKVKYSFQQTVSFLNAE